MINKLKKIFNIICYNYWQDLENRYIELQWKIIQQDFNNLLIDIKEYLENKERI